jgi:hypothetical protein
LKKIFILSIFLICSSLLSQAQNMGITITTNYVLMDSNTLRALDHQVSTHQQQKVVIHSSRNVICATSFDTTTSFYIQNRIVTNRPLKTTIHIMPLSPHNSNELFAPIATCHNQIDSAINTQLDLPVPVYNLNPVYTVTKQ